MNMSGSIAPEVTPEKIYPYLKQANQDQAETLYRLAFHVIKGKAPQEKTVPLSEFMDLLKEGTNRQLLLIIQAAFHIVHRERMN